MRVADKLILLYILTLAGVSFASEASAATYQATAIPSSISAMSSSMGIDDTFQLTGVTSLGSCATGSGGLVSIRIKKETSTDPTGSRLFTLVMAAITLQKPIFVQVNDNNKDGAGACYADYVKFSG